MNFSNLHQHPLLLPCPFRPWLQVPRINTFFKYIQLNSYSRFSLFALSRLRIFSRLTSRALKLVIFQIISTRKSYRLSRFALFSLVANLQANDFKCIENLLMRVTSPAFPGGPCPAPGNPFGPGSPSIPFKFQLYSKIPK